MALYEADEKRYEEMSYVPSGKSGLKLPRIALGLWHNFGDTSAMENMKSLCRTAFDHGITWPGPYGNWGSRKYLFASLDQSLGRLGLDYVDIFYHHRMDPETPLEETMTALADIVRSGKALYAGLSNYDGKTMREAAKLLRELHCPFIVNQNRYSIFDRTIEKNGLKEAAVAEGKGIVAFSPLCQGLLTEKYLHGIPEDSRIRRDGRFLKEKSLTEEKLAAIGDLHDLAVQRGQTLAEMALAWDLKDGAITSTIIGASRPEQILDNIKALENTSFTEEELERIDEISFRPGGAVTVFSRLHLWGSCHAKRD